jgi:DNA transformation protein
MSDKDFIAYLHELFDPFGRMRAKAMFGGWGVYLDEIIVGIVVDGRLYLKTDAQNLPEFEIAGCVPFVYDSPNGPMTMSYWSTPDDAMDSSDAMAPWARSAKAAALRKAAAKPARKRKQAAKPKPKSLEGAPAAKAKPVKPANKRKPAAKATKKVAKRKAR